MKKLQTLTSAMLIALGLFILPSCEKTENQVVLVSSKNPVLTTNRTTSIPLSLATKDDEAIKLNWTNPDFRFNTGISSQAVNYDIEIDTTGKNFNSGKKQVIALSSDLALAISQGTFNDYLLNQLSFAPGVAVAVDIRVRAYVREAPSTSLYSSTLKFNTTPYIIPPKVNPPSTNQLFITGAATGGWMGSGDSPTSAVALSKKFVRISSTLYELASFSITANEEYLLVPMYGDWSNKFGYVGGGAMNNVNSDDFKDGGNNFKAPGSGGNYKIVVDFQKGKYFFTKL